MHRIVANVSTGEVTQVPLTAEEEVARQYAIDNPPVPSIAEENARIKREIAILDLKRIRPLAEGDTAFLATLNDQIVTLRGRIV